MMWIRGALALLAAGLAWVGVSALLDALPRRADVITFGLWFLVPPVLSDLVLMPTVAVVGWVLHRFAAPWLRTPLIVALVGSAALIAVAAPFLTRPGLRPDNPTLLDRNYPLGVAVTVAVIWASAGVWALVRQRGSRRTEVSPTTRP
ncbi:hypothetical protein [Williamsia sp. CHRR-6]|uniref:hypothetical protein n=1 Tax=Williamsia sp. CHRR-6 TaxID=2835871 RepID=UPI001BDA951F|nr:hypothetical protein [Williamsia sp. CHRR-6]MBT0566371.1 hypothetical protein [Williamsia sp. CHRR-6]